MLASASGGGRYVSFDDPLDFLGAEKISYVVLQTPSQDITSGNKKPYSLIGKISGNFGFYPEAGDSFLYNMFRVNPYKIGTSKLNEVPYSPLTKFAQAPQSSSQVTSFIKKLPDIASETGNVDSTNSGVLQTDFEEIKQGVSSTSELTAAAVDLEGKRFVHILAIPKTELLARFIKANSIDATSLEVLLDQPHRLTNPFATAVISSGLSFINSETGQKLLKAAGRSALNALTGGVMNKKNKKKNNNITSGLKNLAPLLKAEVGLKNLRLPKHKKKKKKAKGLGLDPAIRIIK